MSLFLAFCFLFFIGSLVGWVLELLYAKLTMKKLINPGFFVGPWVPIYGFGLCVVTFIYIVVTKYDINPFLSGFRSPFRSFTESQIRSQPGTGTRFPTKSAKRIRIRPFTWMF